MSKPDLPRRADLPVRYTAEVTVTWRVWDVLTEQYVDPFLLGRDEESAEHLAVAMESVR